MTTFLAQFHFMYPLWLLLLLVIPALWLWAFKKQRQQGEWRSIVDEALMPFVLTGQENTANKRALIIYSLILALLVLAMAGPAWEKREVPVFREQQAVAVALDLSLSMYAEDEKPNRLTLARFELLDLLESRQDGQTGLVVFAGDAFIVAPLTDDTENIATQVKSLSPGIMPVQGSNVAAAISKALELLQQGEAKQGSIVVMTDGLNNSAAAQQAASAAAQAGFPVSVMSIGSAEGAPVPLGDGQLLKTNNGQTVIPKVDFSSLQQVANAGDGLFVKAALGDADLQALSTLWQSDVNDGLQDGDGREIDIWQNEGIWLVLLILPLALLGFRRGWVFALVLVVLPHSETVQASFWDDLWRTPDQQAQEALQQNDAARAAELFEDPDHKAAAAYRAESYDQAAQLFRDQNSLSGQYNYGNALAKQGQLKEALAAYDQALTFNPKHDDVLHNRFAVQKALEEQQAKQSAPDAQQSGENQQGSSDGAEGEDSQSGSGEQNESATEQQNADSQPPEGEQEQADSAQGQQQDEAERENSEQQGEQASELAALENMEQREQQQAVEQWLRRIPDDPAGLWRRKFQYQYRQRAQQQPPQQGQAW